MPLRHLRPYFIVLILLLTAGNECWSQCSVQTGPPPPFSIFNSSSTGNAWSVAINDINGPYNPAVLMSTPSGFYISPSSSWISFSTTGEHTGNRFFFFKMNVELPCFNTCGQSFNDDNTFCLPLDLYTDNSVFEIYVNGIAQSGNGVGIVQYSDPYNPVGHTQNDKTAVYLCRNWKAGNNTVIIQVASSATLMGLLVEAPRNPSVTPDTVTATICDRQTYTFYNQAISEAGYYTATYKGINGCDSTKVLHLNVSKLPGPAFETRPVICAGDSLVLFPGSFASYQWQDGSTGDHYTVKSPGMYSVTVTNSCGFATKDITIRDGLCNIYFPNAFTPDNNRKNETFKILTDLTFSFYNLVIYNRWGQKVFETHDARAAWDGKIKGADQPAGTYVWVCRMTKSGVTSHLKGYVMLLR